MLFTIFLCIANPILILTICRKEVLFFIRYCDDMLEYKEENLALAIIAGVSIIPVLSHILFFVLLIICYVKLLYTIIDKIRKGGNKKCGK